ncbi:MAG: LysR family transcriptional regulator substrate-binding protein [Nocardioidaceae bacterium]
MVLGPVHDDLPDQFVVTTLADESLVLVTAPGTLRHRSTRVSLRDVRGYPFACLPSGSGLHGIVTNAAAQEGFTPHIQFEASDPAGVRQFVAAGLGVALLAKSTVDQAGPAVDAHTLTKAPAHPPIGMIRVRGRRLTPTLRAWYTHVKDAARSR